MPSRDKVEKTGHKANPLDTRIVSWNKQIARERGWLFALTELDAVDPELLSPKTDAFIRSQLLWLKGDIDESIQLLGALTPDNDEEVDALLAERQRRLWEAGQQVDAAKVALDRLALLAPGAGTVTSSTISICYRRRPNSD